MVDIRTEGFIPLDKLYKLKPSLRRLTEPLKHMSWSLHYIGTPTKIVAALKAHSETLTGTSKEEYDKVVPNLVNLVEQCHNDNAEPVLSLSANGHTSAGYGNCTVNLKYAEGTLV